MGSIPTARTIKILVAKPHLMPYNETVGALAYHFEAFEVMKIYEGTVEELRQAGLIVSPAGIQKAITKVATANAKKKPSAAWTPERREQARQRAMQNLRPRAPITPEYKEEIRGLIKKFSLLTISRKEAASFLNRFGKTTFTGKPFTEGNLNNFISVHLKA